MLEKLHLRLWYYILRLDSENQTLRVLTFLYRIWTRRPPSFVGRLFCIFCALIGIPLNLGVLKTVGERITKYIRSTVKHIEKNHLKRRRPNRVGVKVAGVAFIMMVIVLLVGGASDMHGVRWMDMF